MTDYEITKNAKYKDIEEVAKSINLKKEDYYICGKNILKIENYKKKDKKDLAKLILVSAITPTKSGEGKTTITISLSDALNKLGKKSIVSLREPSLGPVFGLKGGACGGGYSQVIPTNQINLHFTGDMHAISCSNNLISSFIDNHIYYGNKLNIDPKSILFNRVIDLNDRNLRNIITGLGNNNGVLMPSKFNITAASEIMACLCLSKDLMDLKKRINNILIGYTYDKKMVFLKDLEIGDSVISLLTEAIKPNLVQTLENNPAIIHGGPFANIAHGCSSIIATNFCINNSEYCVTEAGFGADLGAEKFLDIKCQTANIKPACVVLVATIKALKLHGGVKYDDLHIENLEAIETGFKNLKRHYENLSLYNIPIIVCLNSFYKDTEKENEIFVSLCKKNNMEFSISKGYMNGSSGSIDLANKVIKLANNKNFKPLYLKEENIFDKILKVCKKIYRAKDVNYSSDALLKIKKLEKNGIKDLYVCFAKTQYSFSNDKNKINIVDDFTINITDVEYALGANFIVLLCGDIIRMPGLPKELHAPKIKVLENGEIIDLF